MGTTIVSMFRPKVVTATVSSSQITVFFYNHSNASEM